MGDISMRGKGRALKMKSGGSTTERRKKAREDKPSRGVMILTNPPKFKPIPSLPERVGPKPKRPGPKRPEFGPRPRPMPRPDRRPSPRPMPMPKPMPDRSPRIKEKIKELMEELKPRRRQTGIPVKRKDGGEISFADLLSKPAAKGFSKDALKKAFEKAKKFKPSGRLNMDDIKRAMDMITKGAGKGLGSSLLKKTEPKIKGRLGGPKTSPKRRTKLRKLI